MKAMRLMTPCLVLLLPALCHSLAVMSVDLGSEWIKIGVVSPGVPLDIALNRESKRKTPMVVALRDGVRQYGEEAATTGVRFPELSYSHLVGILGKHFDLPAVKRHQARFPHLKMVADPQRHTVVFQHSQDVQLTVEELISMILSDARSVASAHTGQPVTDAVITVPAYWGQSERRALLSSAQLAGIKTLQLINDNAAVALNYGMFRRSDFNSTPYYILFYDVGAGSASASLVSYQLVKSKERGIVETNPQLQVLAYSYDETLSGTEMTLRLRDHLAAQFTQHKKTAADVYQDRRAMAKLWREAERVKRILSANAETYAQVEGLLDDEDFRHLVKREQFETLCADLYPRVAKLVETTVKSAGMKIENVDQLMLVGGSSRVPWLQEQLQLVWKDRELSRSINADEAAALGAVYRAAELSTGFRVMKFHVRDHVTLPVVVDFEREIENEAGEKERRLVRRNLFSLGNPYPQKKVITFNRNTQDFGFTINYGDLSHLSDEQISNVGGLNLSYVLLNGVADAFAGNTGDNIDARGIKVHFHMDDSGLLNLTSVETVFDHRVAEDEAVDDESTLSKLGSAFSKMFSSSDEGSSKDAAGEETADSSSSDPTNTTSDSAGEQATSSETEKSSTTTTTASTGDNNNATAVKTKIKSVKVPIKFSETNLNVADISEQNLQLSKNKLSDMDEADRQRMRRERSRNALESFINEAQSRVYEDKYERASTEEERQAIATAASQMSDWLYEDGFDESAAVFEEKLEELKKLTQALYDRVEEHSNREEAVSALNNVLNMTQHFVVSANQSADVGIIKHDDVAALNKMLTATQEWLKMKLAEQDSTPLTETPKLKMSALADKYTALDREVKYLVNKIKIGQAQKQKEEADRKLKEELDKLKLNITETAAADNTSETEETSQKKESGGSEKESKSGDAQTDDTVSSTAELPASDGGQTDQTHSEL